MVLVRIDLWRECITNNAKIHGRLICPGCAPYRRFDAVRNDATNAESELRKFIVVTDSLGNHSNGVLQRPSNRLHS